MSDLGAESKLVNALINDTRLRAQFRLLLLVAICIAGCPHQPEIRPWHLPAITSDDPRAEAELREARELLERGAVKEAEQRYQDFIAQRPKDPLLPIARLGLGRIRLSQNQLPAALELFKMVAAHPDPSIAEQGKFYQGVATHLLGDHRGAIKLLAPMQGRTIDPEDTALLLRTLAAAWAAENDFVDALKALDALVKEAISERDRVEARGEIAEIAVKRAGREQIELAYRELARDGSAWPQVARRALKDADRDGKVEKMREIMQALKDADIEFDAELEALELRAARPAEANPQVIGALLSLSGRAREVGEMALRGLMLAADLPPSGPPAPGAPQLVFRDDTGDPEQTVQALNELVSVHRAVAIIGPIDARAAAAASARANELGVPLIALAPVAGITDAGPMAFRLFPTPDDEARKLVAYARGRGAARFAVLHPKGAYGSAMLEAFSRQVELQKGQLTAVESYEPQATDFSRQVGALIRAEFDALFVADASSQLALIAPALAVGGLWSAPASAAAAKGARAIVLLAPSVAFDPHLGKNAGRYLQGAVFSVPFDPSTATGAARLFADKFQTRFGARADCFAAFAYDAYRLVRTAVERGAATRQQVAQYLSSARDANTAGPSPGFSPDRGPLEGTRLLELQGDAFVPVKDR